MQCRHCGESITEDDSFCPECGKKVTKKKLDQIDQHEKTEKSIHTPKEKQYNIPGIIIILFISVVILVALASYALYTYFTEQQIKLFELQKIRNEPDPKPSLQTIVNTEPSPNQPSNTQPILDGTITIDIDSYVEFESKTLKGRDNTFTTKYKISSITLSITNRKPETLTLEGTLIVLDSKGNNAISPNFIYKTFNIDEIQPGASYTKKQPVNTPGDIRPYLTGVNTGDKITLQVTLKIPQGDIVKKAQKTVVVI